MITFDWTVKSLAVEPTQNGKENVVVFVLFCVTAKDQEFTVEFLDGVKLEYTSGDFTPYNLLEEAQIIGWVKHFIGKDKEKNIEDNLKAQIESRKNPLSNMEILPLPWNT